MTDAYFFNVGQGNMVVVIFPDNFILVYDCNITVEREDSIFTLLNKIMPKKYIDVFVNSHRDSDHMRGIKKLNDKYPIKLIIDSDVSGNTDTKEYSEYMDVRRNIGFDIAKPFTHLIKKNTVQFLNGKRDNLNDPNSQSIVVQIDHSGSKLLLAGDTNVSSWKDYIMHESKDRINSLVLYASHHGSFTFFNENIDTDEDYINHIKLIYPAITIFSVGEDNSYGHPDNEALEYYEKYSYGTADKGYKIFRTDKLGNMRLQLIGGGTGTIYWNV